jgi:perosamine synthetase
MGETVMEIPLSKMYVDDQIEKAVLNVLNSGRYINGQHIKSFEQEFAGLCGTQYAVGVSSGTSAILLSLMALGIGEGDEVIVPSHTFIATASPAKFLGATIVYADIDPEAYTIDPAEVKRKITARTRAVIPVHLYGHPCDMDPINELARAHNIYVIEDACQAHGASYYSHQTQQTSTNLNESPSVSISLRPSQQTQRTEHRVGSLGDIACFSFFPSKNMTVLGDGGMITTNDSQLAHKVGMLRDHGRTQKYVHDMLGLNCRLSELHAAIGREQLKHLTEWTEKRRAIAARYDALLRDSGVVTPVEREWARHVYYMYVVRVKQRDKLASYLKSKSIETGIHYPVPVHRQPCLKSDVHLPITERYVDEILSLPMHPQLSDEQVAYVASEVRSFMEDVGCRE